MLCRPIVLVRAAKQDIQNNRYYIILKRSTEVSFVERPAWCVRLRNDFALLRVHLPCACMDMQQWIAR